MAHSIYTASQCCKLKFFSVPDPSMSLLIYSSGLSSKISSSSSKFGKKKKDLIILFITCRAKLLNADWLRQRAFFLNQEGMITWCWLAEHACIKLVSRFKRSLKRNFRNASLLSLILTGSFYLNLKENQHTQQSAVFWWKSKRIFPTKNVLIRSLKTVWVGTAGVERSTRQNFVASKLKVIFLVFLRVALLVLQA